MTLLHPQELPLVKNSIISMRSGGLSSLMWILPVLDTLLWRREDCNMDITVYVKKPTLKDQYLHVKRNAVRCLHERAKGIGSICWGTTRRK